MKYISILLISLFLFSCGPSSKQKELDQIIQKKLDSALSGIETATQTEKVIQKEDFVSVLKSINISNINQYIHPQNGLRLIQSSGAMPNMTSTSQVDKNFPVDFSAVKEEELPKVNCDSKTFWTKDGCFSQFFLCMQFTLPPQKEFQKHGLQKLLRRKKLPLPLVFTEAFQALPL